MLCILVLFVLTGCTTSEIEYETSRDEVIYSPSGNYSITLRYDYVSRPYIFKDDTLVYLTPLLPLITINIQSKFSTMNTSEQISSQGTALF